MDISKMAPIGCGAQADIYLLDGKAVKVFKPEYPQADARREAKLQDMAHKAGLPVPAIYDINDLDGRPAIVMEYVKGQSLGEIMLVQPEKAYHCLDMAADMHMKMHAVSADGFPSQHENLENDIMTAGHLENAQRRNLLRLLKSSETGNQLCHGDFHVANLIQTTHAVKIIDWADSSRGNALADVCRSYLLYLLYRSEVAPIYLEIYCSKANVSKRDVLRWLPIVAGARLHENVTARDVALLLNLVDDPHAE